ncbi:metal-dependent hydrolase [Candidatus Nitronereus thalassa]|uniref:Metal-dependent hydrolase n=1 Tax=Candidatus Nitronereus thalassa TaxID=3020898 RepID=A0ABU3K3B4_9BACT|nr:metal-dependent hydrolase [Candidatus Nitronereus thalassa]MDT7040890.1 metal-dependent hydrolase [Candidatus Nitronereus thalassa]
MASWLTHAFVAGALGKAQVPHVRTVRFWMWSVLCSVLPDVDVLGLFMGIDYGHALGHRGFMHSLSFSFGVGLVTVMVGFSHVVRGSTLWWILIFHFTVVTASHGVLDAMTNGGLGVAFFAPFDNTRYFLPWTPILVSPIGAEFFGWRGLEVIASEIFYVWIPILVIASGVAVIRKTLADGNSAELEK